MNDGWDRKKEDLLFSWANQLGINRDAHANSAVRCRDYYYAIKIPHILFMALNIGVGLAAAFAPRGHWRIALIVLGIVIPVCVFFLDNIISLFSWSEASVQHSGTVRELDSLRFEIQREYYTPRSERRHWEPLMVFITEKINQINSTKTTKLLRKNHNDSLADTMALRWMGIGNDDFPDDSPRDQSYGDNLAELMEQGEIYNSIENLEKKKAKTLWRRVLDTIQRPKSEPKHPEEPIFDADEITDKLNENDRIIENI